jgi:hypothetical protein
MIDGLIDILQLLVIYRIYKLVLKELKKEDE